MPMAIAIIASALAGSGVLAAVARKWQLPTREAAALIMLASAGASALVAWLAAGNVLRPAALPPAFCAAQLSLFVGGILLRFYRDPERMPPPDPCAILSPADGTVAYLRRLTPGAVLQAEKKGRAMGLTELQETPLAREELWQIGISMVFTDVHVNRAPIAGRIVMVRRRPGLFLSLRRQEAASANERQTVVLERDGVPVAVVQIASRLVRRIRAFVGEGEQVERGQRIGAITFGSQVDLFVPLRLCPKVLVAPGQHVTAGQTAVGRLSMGRESQMGGDEAGDCGERATWTAGAW